MTTEYEVPYCDFPDTNELTGYLDIVEPENTDQATNEIYTSLQELDSTVDNDTYTTVKYDSQKVKRTTKKWSGTLKIIICIAVVLAILNTIVICTVTVSLALYGSVQSQLSGTLQSERCITNIESMCSIRGNNNGTCSTSDIEYQREGDLVLNYHCLGLDLTNKNTLTVTTKLANNLLTCCCAITGGDISSSVTCGLQVTRCKIN